MISNPCKIKFSSSSSLRPWPPPPSPDAHKRTQPPPPPPPPPPHTHTHRLENLLKYHPISLISVPCKLVDWWSIHIIVSSVMGHIKSNIICKEQHDFWAAWACGQDNSYHNHGNGEAKWHLSHGLLKVFSKVQMPSALSLSFIKYWNVCFRFNSPQANKRERKYWNQPCRWSTTVFKMWVIFIILFVVLLCTITVVLHAL